MSQHWLDRPCGEPNTKSGNPKDDFTAPAHLVATALTRHHGWAEVDRDSIIVKDSRGHGHGAWDGRKKYKVWAPGIEAVALHKRTDPAPDSALSTARKEAAALLLSKQGLYPKRLAQGTEWYIERWVGYGSPVLITKADMGVLATELAKMHKLPTEWYSPFRDKLRQLEPAFAAAPEGSRAL